MNAHCSQRPGGRCIDTPGGGGGHDPKACAYQGAPYHEVVTGNLAGGCGNGVCLNQGGTRRLRAVPAVASPNGRAKTLGLAIRPASAQEIRAEAGGSAACTIAVHAW